MQRLTLRTPTAAACILLPTAAFAHTGLYPHMHVGFLAGLTHPLTGADHLATMVSVGLWAGLLGGRALWAVPLSFVTVMIAGAAIGAAGVPLPGIEPMIALSVVALGLITAFRLRLPTGFAAALVGVFALFHGHAHGAEMPGFASPLLYGLGFVAATAALHGAGIGTGLALNRAGPRISAWATRIAGPAIAGFGAWLLVAG